MNKKVTKKEFPLYFKYRVWAKDKDFNKCNKCKKEFSFTVHKHHCRKCGLIFCDSCSKQKMLIPSDEVVLRPVKALKAELRKNPKLYVDEDKIRVPKRVCDNCAYALQNMQADLRILLARCNQDTFVSPLDKTGHLAIPSIDFRLEQEVKNSTKMLNSFNNKLGAISGEYQIPKKVLQSARGVVFLTILKAGFMFTGRYGTGLVIAKLDNGTWSAPSAITISGIGWGFQIGAEITEVMLILDSDQAVDTFKSKAQISLGAELALSVGPVGRSVAADLTAGNKGAAHAFSYAHAKGLFFGASLEASGISSRSDVNRNFYGQDVTPAQLLSGEYPPPRASDPLYKALQAILIGNETFNLIKDQMIAEVNNQNNSESV